jgi:hypothetical protein
MNKTLSALKQDDYHHKDSVGGFDFALAENEVYILEHNAGRFTGAVPPLKVMNILGLGEQAALARKMPEIDEHIDIEEIWDLIKDNELGLDACSGVGVLPFFCIDGELQVMVFGQDKTSIERMYDRLENLLFKKDYFDAA